MLHTLKRVFSRIAYVTVALCASGTLLLFLAVLPQRTLLWSAVSSGALSLGEKWDFVVVILALLGGNMSAYSTCLSIIIAVLFGIQVALLLYYMRRRRTGVGEQKRVHMTSIGGMVAALFGVGCAACGSVIITALLGLIGASGLLLALPFHGYEFGVVGVALLLVSIFYLARRISDPLICSV